MVSDIQRIEMSNRFMSSGRPADQVHFQAPQMPRAVRLCRVPGSLPCSVVTTVIRAPPGIRRVKRFAESTAGTHTSDVTARLRQSSTASTANSQSIAVYLAGIPRSN